MNKAELVAAVAEKSGLSKKDAAGAVDAFVDSIVGAVTSGNKVQIVGFGTFEVRHRAERVGHNPRKGTTIQIPASNAPVFKAGKAFKDSVSGK
ncbi:MAG: HU family DNA-binding protein [Firmicutes bacterium]|nr:HU family DNA-binding protein [Bacillota bacterium]